VSTRLMIFSALALVTVVGRASAQGVAPAKKCDRPDTTAAWYKTQRDWWALDAKHDWSNDSLRAALVAAARNLETAPMKWTFPIQLGVLITPGAPPSGAVDPEQIGALRAELRAMAQQRKAPTRSVVGVAGEHAAWLIAGGDSATMVGFTHQLMEAGPDESSASDVAVIEDWLRTMNGRKPIYASQVRAVRDAKGETTLQPIPTEDLAHVDLRRENAALPPLAFALCVANAGLVRGAH
jgi:hypothetical protein